MIKQIRIVCRKGKYALRTVVMTDDGEIIKIIADDVDLFSKDLGAFKRILDAVCEARKLPIIQISAANAHLYGCCDIVEEG